MTSSQPLEPRLERIERTLAWLSTELVAIRAEVAAGAAASPIAAAREEPAAAVPFPRAAPGSPPPPRDNSPPRSFGGAVTPLDLERLLGRYGMLAIAVLAAAAAVGTFLSWAISRGYLHFNPAVRVLIGLAFATGIAIWGLRMRRTERSFGSSLVGLALVIVHICAYAAGPGFHLVPTIVAFAGAGAVSWALALFALHENDETLWCVGLGGASLAPFVTSDGHGSVYTLLAYGTLITLPACLAISHREWPVAWRVFYGVTALFTIAGASIARVHGVPGMLAALAFPFVIGAVGVIPFAPESRKRAALRWLLALALVVVPANDFSDTLDSGVVAASLVAAMCLTLLFADRLVQLPQSSMFALGRESSMLLDWLDVAVLPALFIAEAVNVAKGEWPIVTVYAAGVALFSVFSWRRKVGALRDASAAAAAAMALMLVASLPLDTMVARIGGYLLVGLIALAMHALRPSRGSLVTGLGSLVFSAMLGAFALSERPTYEFTPFTTVASLGAALTTLAFIIASRFWPTLFAATVASIPDRPRRTYASALSTLIRGLTVAPWVWAFVWVLIELAMAYSPSTSTLLLVTYFASTGVGCVGVGRWRQNPRLRQVGLGLALVAAATAIYGASTYFDFGARIAAYLVTSAFLLGIAYWYRRAGGTTVSPASAFHSTP